MSATPGPWELAQFGLDDPVEQFRQHLSHGSGPVWAVWCPAHPLSVGEHPAPKHAVLSAVTGNGPQSEANARFIASAPDLFAACEAAVAVIELHADPTCCDGDQHHEDKCRVGQTLVTLAAAISKARGGGR